MDGPLHGDECLSHHGAVCAHLGDEVIEAAMQSTHVPVGKPYKRGQDRDDTKKGKGKHVSHAETISVFARSVTVFK
jgi:hypothetical protein